MRFTRAMGFAGALAFLLLGLFCGFKGIGNLRRASASTTWPQVEATVARSATVASTSRSDSDRTTNTSYSADLEFRYQVNGAPHLTTLRHFGQIEGSTDSSEAELLRLRYPQGARIAVFYDPADPSTAVAEPGFHPGSLMLPAAGLFLILPALMFIALLAGDANAGLSEAGIVLFGAIFFSLGAIGLLCGGLQMWRAHSSEGWPRASGELVYDHIDSSESVNKQRGTLTTRGTSYGAHLVYRYPVGGRTYYSNVRRFGQLSGAGADWADAIAAKYPARSRFPVFYFTVDPQLAVLEPGLSSEALWLPGAGLASMLFGLAVIVFARRALAAPQAAPVGRTRKR